MNEILRIPAIILFYIVKILYIILSCIVEIPVKVIAVVAAFLLIIPVVLFYPAAKNSEMFWAYPVIHYAENWTLSGFKLLSYVLNNYKI